MVFKYREGDQLFFFHYTPDKRRPAWISIRKTYKELSDQQDRFTESPLKVQSPIYSHMSEIIQAQPRHQGERLDNPNFLPPPKLWNWNQSYWLTVRLPFVYFHPGPGKDVRAPNWYLRIRKSFSLAYDFTPSKQIPFTDQFKTEDNAKPWPWGTHKDSLPYPHKACFSFLSLGLSSELHMI